MVCMDADLQHEPEAVPGVARPVLVGEKEFTCVDKDLPMIKKGQSGGDITFVASVFTGALATFGLTTSNSKAASNKPDPKKKEE